MRGSRKNGERIEQVRKGKKGPAKVEPLRPTAISESLVQIEERFRDILRSSADLLWEVDENCVFTYCEGAVKAIFGVAAKELVGKRPFDLMPAEEAHRAQSAIGEIFQRKDPIKDFEALYEDRKGRQHWLRTTGGPVLDERGSLKGYRGVCKDITERKRTEEALRETTQTLEAVIQASPLPIFALDRERIVKTWNPAAERTFGWSAQEVIGRQYPAIPKEKMDEADALFSRALEGGLTEVETLRQRKDGSLMDVSISAAPLRDSRGNINGVMAVLTDITERKKLEETVEKERKELKLIIDSSPIIVFYKDKEGRFVRVNKAFAEALNIPEEKFPGKTVFDFYSAKIAQGMTNDDQEVFRTGRAKLNIIEQYESVRGPRWVQTDKVPIFDKDGIVAGLVGFAQDITERVQAEEELQKERDFARSLVETAQAIVLVLDTRGRIVSFNPYMEEISGYKLEEVLGFDWFSTFVPKRDRERIRELFKKATADIQTSGNVNSIVTKNGQEREIEWYDKTLKGKDGNIIGVLSTGQDITERKLAQEQLQEERNLLRTVIDQIPDAVYVKDKDSRFIACNKALLEYWDAKDENSVIGKTDFDFYESDRAKGFREEEKKVIQTGEPAINREGQWEDKAGNVHHVLTTKVALRNSQNNIIGIVGINRDVTERKMWSERLEQERNLLRTLIDHIPDKVYVKDRGSRFIACNKSTIASHGVKREEELIGKTDFDLHEQALAQQFFDKEQELMRTGRPIINCEIPASDGSVRSMLVTKVPLRDSSGNVIGIVGINRDITARKKAEGNIRRLNRVMEMITEVNQFIFRIKDRDELLKKVCDAIVGYAYRMVWIGFCDEKTKRIVPQAQAGFEKGYLKSIEITYDDSEQGMGPTGMAVKTARPNIMQFIATDPQYEPWREKAIKRGYRSSAAIPIFGEDKVIGVLNVYADKDDAFNQEEVKLLEELAHDISTGLRGIDEQAGRRQAEQKLVEHQKQLKRLAAQLTLAEERERLQIAGELHDQVGQSLALAKIKLDALRASATSRPADEVLADVSETLQQMMDKTRSLTFDLSYPILYEFGFEAAVAEWLNEQVQDKHGIITEFADDGQSKPLDDDVRVLLFRNVRELLINCIKHANADRVKVGIRRIDDSIEVIVEDNGIGFDHAEARAVMDKQVGFGLFSIRERLEELGGRFEIESKPGAGCRAVMTAPLEGRPRKKEK